MVLLEGPSVFHSLCRVVLHLHTLVHGVFLHRKLRCSTVENNVNNNVFRTSLVA